MNHTTASKFTDFVAAVTVAAVIMIFFLAAAWLMDAVFDVSKSTTMFALLIANTVYTLYVIARD